MGKLTGRELMEVQHWRLWLQGGGKKLVNAQKAIEPLLAIIDRLTEKGGEQ